MTLRGKSQTVSIRSIAIRRWGAPFLLGALMTTFCVRPSFAQQPQNNQQNPPTQTPQPQNGESSGAPPDPSQESSSKKDPIPDSPDESSSKKPPIPDAPADDKPKSKAKPGVLPPEDDPAWDPFHAQQDVDIGKFYLDKGDLDAAIARFEEAVQLRANFAKPRLLLAETYEKKGDKQEAVRYYKEYLQVLPNAPDAKKVKEKIEKLSSSKK
jgi:tetratricopeptide (TPR) repeat protein